ncbi:MAG TPA: DUF2207 domain-containing protein [Candidatus Saccharimonadales bacterium]
MKFIGRCLGVGVLLVVLSAVLLPARSFAADPNDFTVRSFEVDYYLSRDSDKRSTMRVVEKLVAQFPPYDQNHGIERAIPEEYDGHKVNLEIVSAKNESGKAWPYSTYASNQNTVMRIGDPNKYVRNLQTYVIEYKLSDVAKGFGNHDELYWDTNGTDWGQPFATLTARLHIDGKLAGAFNGNTKCYEGSQGSTNNCAVSREEKNGETVLTFQASRMLYAGENMTFVAGFDKGTFRGYQPTTLERVLPWIIGGWFALGGLVLAVVIFRLWRAWQRFGRSPDGRGTVVPEYLPPKDMSVLTSSVIIKKDGKDETAQIIDLAVRHYIRIYEIEAKQAMFFSKKTYELELVKKLTGLRIEEKKLLEIIFGAKPEVGQRVTLEALKTKLYKDAAALQKDTTEFNALANGLLADMSSQRKHYYIVGGLLLGGGVLVLNVGVAIAGTITLIIASMLHPLTEKGVEKRDYLRGLEMYMKLAEAERMRVLQSPTGASKTKVDPNDKKQLVHLYERLLPYAIIFGLEKDWAKVFTPLYDKQPDWYVGNWSTFNAAVFASSLSNFATTGYGSFTPPSNSSSSGFGGGFSGGGGGGGGGGGW